jgi:hypothetical protein
MPRGSRFDAGALELISRMACTTPSEAARALGAKKHTMQLTLERLVSIGALRKYLVMERLAVYCAPSAAPGDAIKALVRALGISEKLLLKKIADAVAGARSRRLCISNHSLYPLHIPAVSTAVAAYVASLLGGGVKRRRGRIYICVDVEEARRRLEAGELHPPDGVVRPAEPYYVVQPRERMALISFHLPPRCLKAMDELVATGRYANRSAVVREAVRQMLERLRP